MLNLPPVFFEEEKIGTNTKGLEWFLDRIGKRIWRDRGTCTCSSCEEVYRNGIVIKDESHAKYLHMIEQDFAVEGVFLNYRDYQDKKDSEE